MNAHQRRVRRRLLWIVDLEVDNLHTLVAARCTRSAHSRVVYFTHPDNNGIKKFYDKGPNSRVILYGD